MKNIVCSKFDNSKYNKYSKYFNTKYIILFLLFLFFIILPNSYAENISVELLPNNIATNVGNTITLDLVVKNIPTDTKCGGFETNIIYNSNIINLTNIVLSNVGDTANMKTIDVNSGKISLAWFSNLPSGNFTIATLTFKALNDGTDNISLSNVVISNENGIKYNNLIVNNSNVVINQLNQTIGTITLKDFEINKDISMILSINGAKTPIKNISGSILLKNISIISNPSQIDLFFKSFQYSITKDSNNGNNNFSFFIEPLKEDENRTFFNLLSLPININNSNYNISINLKINNKPINNISINEEKPQYNISEYKGLAFYVDNGYNLETNLSIGYSKEIKLKVVNIDKNLTNFSGYIYINNSLFDVSEYNIPKYSSIYNVVNNSNISLNNSYIYYNISLINGTNGTFSILEFKISPKKNINISSKIYVGNISIYSNNTKINLPSKSLTVNIVGRSSSAPPIAKFGVIIQNNNKVQFYSLCYDGDDDNLNYFWDFGDGKNSTYENPIHTYNNYTDYTVKLAVEDPLNNSDEAITIIPIKKYFPLNYIISNNTLINNGENKTVYLNLTLNNPLNYSISGYVNFVDYNNIKIPKSQYSFNLNCNESKNITIPINLSKSSTIKWNVVYYPLIKTQKYTELSYYIWDYKEDVNIAPLTTAPKIKIIEYNKTIEFNNSKMIIKLNKKKIPNNIVINKTINLDYNYMNKSDILYYYLVAIIGFIIGLVVLKI